jgi:hypothetical protein
VGYTYVGSKWVGPKPKDVAYLGNYIFIAKDSIEYFYPVDSTGAETVVMMHEFGHAVGILVTKGQSESYDRDEYSVMSLLSDSNAGMASAWYYSQRYWETRYLDDY